MNTRKSPSPLKIPAEISLIFYILIYIAGIADIKKGKDIIVKKDKIFLYMYRLGNYPRFTRITRDV